MVAQEASGRRDGATAIECFKERRALGRRETAVGIDEIAEERPGGEERAIDGRTVGESPSLIGSGIERETHVAVAIVELFKAHGVVARVEVGRDVFSGDENLHGPVEAGVAMVLAETGKYQEIGIVLVDGDRHVLPQQPDHRVVSGVEAAPEIAEPDAYGWPPGAGPDTAVLTQRPAPPGSFRRPPPAPPAFPSGRPHDAAQCPRSAE